MKPQEFQKQMAMHRIDDTQDDQFHAAAASMQRFAYGFDDDQRTALAAIMERAKLPEGDALMPQTSRKIGEILEEVNAIYGNTIKS